MKSVNTFFHMSLVEHNTLPYILIYKLIIRWGFIPWKCVIFTTHLIQKSVGKLAPIRDCPSDNEYILVKTWANSTMLDLHSKLCIVQKNITTAAKQLQSLT